MACNVTSQGSEDRPQSLYTINRPVYSPARSGENLVDWLHHLEYMMLSQVVFLTKPTHSLQLMLLLIIRVLTNPSCSV